MKHNRILNRPMFNPNVSAYGRGITTNLVTEQERQKFNYGGRVGLAKGTGWFNFAPSDVENIKRTDSGEIDYDYYEKEDLKVPTTWGEKLLPSVFQFPNVPLPIKLYGREEKEKADFEADRREREMREKWEGPGIWGHGPEREKIDEEKESTDWFPKGKEEVVDEESDVIDWTPEEKQEKKGQIQLAMAERLIGGARDPLGSTKQQKNLAGMFGDIRKITDKEDLRKWKRRYEAEADAYVRKMGEANKLTRDYDTLIGTGVLPGEALRRSTGIQSKTIPSQAADKKGRKKAVQNLKPGDVIWDEAWYVMSPDGKLNAVTKEQIIEKDKSGELREWKELGITKTLPKSRKSR